MCDVDVRALVAATARAYLAERESDDLLATRLRRTLGARGVPLAHPPFVAGRRMAEAVIRAEEATVEDGYSPAGGWWRDPDGVESFLVNLADEVMASCVAVSER